MRLVLDVEWETCYIEVTKAEVDLMRWPSRRTPQEIADETTLFLHGHIAVEDLYGSRKPEGYQVLADRAYALSREAREAGALSWRDASRNDGPMLYGVPARVVG